MTTSWGGGWQVSARPAARDSDILAAARLLAAEFDRFSFGICETRDHPAIAAVRVDRDEPGVYAIVTDDLAEMLQALRDDEESFPAGAEGGPPPRREPAAGDRPRGGGAEFAVSDASPEAADPGG